MGQSGIVRYFIWVVRYSEYIVIFREGKMSRSYAFIVVVCGLSACSQLSGSCSPRTDSASQTIGPTLAGDDSRYTLFEYVSAPDGLKALSDKFFKEEFTFGAAQKLFDDLKSMSPRGFSIVVRLFRERESGFLKFLKSIEGKKTAGPRLEDFLQEIIETTSPQLTRPSEAVAFMMQAYLLLAAQRGVSIRLNDGSEIYHVGYALGGGSRKNIRHDLNTGRTFVRLGNNTYYDPSYRDYLEPLQEIMSDEQKRRQFFRQFFNLHVKKSFRLNEDIHPDVKTALLFYASIYLAESHRSQMGKVGKNASHWHEDLLGLTMLAPFVVNSGQWLRYGELRPGNLLSFIIVETSGSGIGPTRFDIRELQA
jgi:hypothetical protein